MLLCVNSALITTRESDIGGTVPGTFEVTQHRDPESKSPPSLSSAYFQSLFWGREPVLMTPN